MKTNKKPNVLPAKRGSPQELLLLVHLFDIVSRIPGEKLARTWAESEHWSVRWPWERDENSGLQAPSVKAADSQGLWRTSSFVREEVGKGRLGPCCTPFHLGVTETWCPNPISLSPLSSDLLSPPILHAAEQIACLIAKTNCCDIHCSSALFSGLGSGRWLVRR